MSAREDILARVRAALADVPPGDDVDVPRAYRTTEPGDLVERFVERLLDYGTAVERVPLDELPRAIARRCAARGLERLAVPRDAPAEWEAAGVELVSEDALDVQALDELAAALTGCGLAIAETGTIVLDGGSRQGTRRLTLVPDFHVCVVAETQIVGGVPEAMRSLAGTLRTEPRPVTFVSGPSATSDIELSRVEGVHGPRTLVVLITR